MVGQFVGDWVSFYACCSGSDVGVVMRVEREPGFRGILWRFGVAITPLVD